VEMPSIRTQTIFCHVTCTGWGDKPSANCRLFVREECVTRFLIVPPRTCIEFYLKRETRKERTFGRERRRALKLIVGDTVRADRKHYFMKRMLCFCWLFT
jgi:hypothetical protein